MDALRFDEELLRRDPATGLDVVTALQHFAIVTYALDPARLRPHLHERFEPDLTSDGAALLSVVPFLDVDFRFARCPWPRFTFGQTNYRAYVTDRETGEHVAWFFGTTLDSWSVAVPRFAWRLPWHRGRIRFDVEHDGARYTRYRMSTRATWAPAEVELEDSGQEPAALAGFDDLETARVLLTHPVRGFFHRRDGALGTYRIWHPEIRATEGAVRRASFALLDRLDLVPLADQGAAHSVLLVPEVEFTIHLPPRRVATARASAR